MVLLYFLNKFIFKVRLNTQYKKLSDARPQLFNLLNSYIFYYVAIQTSIQAVYLILIITTTIFFAREDTADSRCEFFGTAHCHIESIFCWVIMKVFEFWRICFVHRVMMCWLVYSFSKSLNCLLKLSFVLFILIIIRVLDDVLYYLGDRNL